MPVNVNPILVTKLSRGLKGAPLSSVVLLLKFLSNLPVNPSGLIFSFKSAGACSPFSGSRVSRFCSFDDKDEGWPIDDLKRTTSNYKVCTRVFCTSKTLHRLSQREPDCLYKTHRIRPLYGSINRTQVRNHDHCSSSFRCG